MIARVLVLAFAAALAPLAARSEATGLLITSARIVDVDAGTVGPALDVEVRGNRIGSIRKASRHPRHVRTFDAAGRYLVPGFWDVHVHVNSPQYARQWILPLLLAAGVTGVRDMEGDCWERGCANNIEHMRSLQAQLEHGTLAGPRILSIGSALVHGPREGPGDPDRPWLAPGDAAQARQLVEELKRRGVDFIKPYDTLPAPAYFELLRAARAAGLPVSGHVPMSVPTLEALRAGQISIEHAKQPLLDCSGYAPTFRHTFGEWASGRSPLIYRNWRDAARGDLDAGGYYQPILQAFDPQACSALLREIARSGAYYVPTLITRRFEARADEEAFIQDPRLSSVPPALLEQWRRDAAAYRARFAASSAEKRAYVQFYELARRLVGEAHAAGVRVLVGTDTPDSYCFPGSSFHDEMLELAAAGLSNAAILRAATLGAAEFLARSGDYGTIAPGKIADLVVLEGDPLADIRNARRIVAVVRDGRLLDAPALQRLTAEAAEFAAGSASAAR